MAATGTAQAASDTSQTSGSTRFDFVGAGINGYRQTRIRTGTGTPVRLSPGWSSYGYGVDAVVLHLSVQRDTGDGWRTVSSLDHAVGTLDVPVPRFTTTLRQQAVRYRLHSAAYASDASTVQNDADSAPVTVVYENQQRYTGLAKRMYGFMKPFCPGVAVHVSTAAIAGRAELAGQASGGAQSIVIRRSVAEMSVTDQRSIALHECAHTRQWLNYGASPDGDRVRAAAEAKYFVDDDAPSGAGQRSGSIGRTTAFDPQEHAADCASIALNPKGYLGYGGWCSPAERKRGARLLHGLQYDGKPASPAPVG